MKMSRKVLVVIGGMLLLAVLVAPLSLVLYMSETGMREEQLPPPPRLLEESYGNVRPVRVMLQNVQEAVLVSGVFVGCENAFQELEYKDPENIRWIVSAGQEIRAGQILGYYEGEMIIAQYDGILKAQNTRTSHAYLQYELFYPIELQSKIHWEDAQKLQNAGELYADENIGFVQLTYVSSVRNPDGTVDVRLALPDSEYTYGQQITNLPIYTGQELKYQMVLPVDCIYQKVEGEDQPWYVYQMTQQGEPIGEIEVELGYTNGQIVCINQLEMATYYRRIR